MYNGMSIQNKFLGHKVPACAQIELTTGGTYGTIILAGVCANTVYVALVLAITKVL